MDTNGVKFESLLFKFNLRMIYDMHRMFWSYVDELA